MGWGNPRSRVTHASAEVICRHTSSIFSFFYRWVNAFFLYICVWTNHDTDIPRYNYTSYLFVIGPFTTTYLTTYLPTYLNLLGRISSVHTYFPTLSFSFFFLFSFLCSISSLFFSLSPPSSIQYTLHQNAHSSRRGDDALHTDAVGRFRTNPGALSCDYASHSRDGPT